jgi:hypothetical protein
MQTEEQIRARLAEMETKFQEMSEKWDRDIVGKLGIDENGMNSEEYTVYDQLEFAIGEFNQILGIDGE